MSDRQRESRRWLTANLLSLHPFTCRWRDLRVAVVAVVQGVAAGSRDVLDRVGLRGSRTLASAIPPYRLVRHAGPSAMPAYRIVCPAPVADCQDQK